MFTDDLPLHGFKSFMNEFELNLKVSIGQRDNWRESSIIEGMILRENALLERIRHRSTFT